MYVSKNILTIFDEVKKEYLHSEDYRSRFDDFGNPLPPDKSQTGRAANLSNNNHINHKWIWWTAGIATVAVGTGVVVWMVEDGKSGSSANHYNGTH